MKRNQRPAPAALFLSCQPFQRLSPLYGQRARRRHSWSRSRPEFTGSLDGLRSWLHRNTCAQHARGARGGCR